MIPSGTQAIEAVSRHFRVLSTERKIDIMWGSHRRKGSEWAWFQQARSCLTWVSSKEFRIPKPLTAMLCVFPEEGAAMINHRGRGLAIRKFLSTSCTFLKVILSGFCQVRKNISVTNNIVVKCAPWGF